MCEMKRARLIAWIDGELDSAEAALVTAHVEACEVCSRDVRAIRALTGEIGEYARAVAAPRPARWRWAPAAAAAAIVFAAALKLISVPAPDGGAMVKAPEFSDPRIVPVAVPIQDLLPIGAAPPGAVLVGEMVLDVGGTPRSFRLEGTEPIGD